VVTKAEMAKCIEVTLLKPGAGAEEIDQFCKEARLGGFLGAVVLPEYVARAVSLLKGSDVKVATVVGFPDGRGTPEDKARDASAAARDGAQQLHVVVDHSSVKAGDYGRVAAEMEAVKRASAAAASEKGNPAPEIVAVLETCLLSGPERVEACKAALQGGAVSVQAGTGAGPRGAMAGEIMALKKAAGASVPVRAAGGITGSTTARAFIDAGASVLWSEKGMAILKEVELKYF
jgi:deoxyribose-phosphate aldolase